ncbi:MAG: XdhC family protein, partial [Acidimicrobiales bacterium]
FPSAQRLHVAAPLDAAGAVGPERHTYVVVMTHSFRRDRDYLCSFLSTPIAYLGMLGPRARLDRLLEELQAEGISPSPADLVKLHGPAGLDVGAEGPEEIALAIAAEILAVRAARPGSRLRDRSVKRSIGTYQAGEVSVTGERVGARPLRARPVS